MYYWVKSKQSNLKGRRMVHIALHPDEIVDTTSAVTVEETTILDLINTLEKQIETLHLDPLAEGLIDGYHWLHSRLLEDLTQEQVRQFFWDLLEEGGILQVKS
jgi:hypothetical protein